MNSRRLVVCLILLTLLVTCLVAAAKLRATPKYDRIQVGMTPEEAYVVLGEPPPSIGRWSTVSWKCDEGRIWVRFDYEKTAEGDLTITSRITEKGIIQRGPLERLAWLAGWRE